MNSDFDILFSGRVWIGSVRGVTTVSRRPETHSTIPQFTHALSTKPTKDKKGRNKREKIFPLLYGLSFLQKSLTYYKLVYPS
jgi:hypothetical protein